MTQQVKIEWDISVPEDQSENGRNIGSWSNHENLLYAIFLNQHKATMVSKKKRKNCRVFDLMADFIVSRNSLQCRSHHQKLIEKFTEIKNIIHIFKRFFGSQYFREQTLFYTGRGGAQAGQQLKNQQNIITPQQIDAPCAANNSIALCEEPQIKQPQVEKTGLEERREYAEGQCKTEQLLQYYTPCNYYFPNNFIQIPIFTGYYPTYACQ